VLQFDVSDLGVYAVSIKQRKGFAMEPDKRDLSFEALQKRISMLETMSETMKWMTQVSDENEKLRRDLGDHDLTRLQLMDSEREREDLRLAVARKAELLSGVLNVLFELEKSGVKFSESQTAVIADVMKESMSGEQ